MDIPSVREQSLADPGFVGSPEQDTSLAAQASPSFFDPYTSPTSSSYIRTRRPSIGNRSVTSPATRRRANTTSSNRPPTGILRRSGAQTPREHEWSLFGQLMENEGQFRTPSSAQKRTSRRIVSGRSVTTLGNRTSDDPFLTASRVQSPAVEDEDVSHTFASYQVPESSDEDEDETSSQTNSVASSESSYDSESTMQHVKSRWEAIPTIPLLYRNILKCAIAYFIASLFTYNPFLSQLISDIVPYGIGGDKPLPSGHMVATV